jgi:hypothetical protein
MDNPRHVRRQVVHVPVSPGFQQDLFLANHVFLLSKMRGIKKLVRMAELETAFQPSCAVLILESLMHQVVRICNLLLKPTRRRTVVKLATGGKEKRRKLCGRHGEFTPYTD